MISEIYKIEWEYSDVGNINRVRPFLREIFDKEDLLPQDIISDSLLQSTQNNDELEVFYDQIKKKLNIGWNTLVDIADFEDIHVDLALMLAMQKYIVENQEFPRVEDDCFISSVLKLGNNCNGVKENPGFKQSLVGKTKIQFPFDDLKIMQNDFELDFHFEHVSYPDEFLIEYSVAQNCFENGWGNRENFVPVNSSSNAPITLHWCGEKVESTNLCVTVYSTSESSPTLEWTESPLKKKKGLKTSTDDSESYDYYDSASLSDDEAISVDSIACPAVVEPGSCVINDSEADCKGTIDGCKDPAVDCPLIRVGPVVMIASATSGFLLVVGIVIVIVVLLVKKRKSSARHPAENLPTSLPTYARAKQKTRGGATGYSYN
ncbi:Oidioi.mRNA.OKI2018_I69.XSR.g13950.t1.cds [Oikopleura dioica]|uniref:Oidioi.mRNA.OKI2018_I69.XSR.g13950.t1.cds n=1 Tax=Oikopleura dioica TaxID=34765 RepID=A0ABN7S8E5_OIKDI|nr:Oidioi.mRNA.OKI2018_I69.XSR.g13950.t1.cds [Oikopleura dioica]